jgi:hypothetical protein
VRKTNVDKKIVVLKYFTKGKYGKIVAENEIFELCEFLFQSKISFAVTMDMSKLTEVTYFFTCRRFLFSLSLGCFLFAHNNDNDNDMVEFFIFQLHICD